MKKFIASLCLLCVAPIVISHVHGTVSTEREQKRIEIGLQIYKIFQAINSCVTPRWITTYNNSLSKFSSNWPDLGNGFLNFPPSDSPLESLFPHIITDSTATPPPFTDYLVGKSYDGGWQLGEANTNWLKQPLALVMLSPGNQWFQRLAFAQKRFPLFYQSIITTLNKINSYQEIIDKPSSMLRGLSGWQGAKTQIDTCIAELKNLDISSLTSPTDRAQTAQSPLGKDILSTLSVRVQTPDVRNHTATYKLWYQNKPNDEIVSNIQNIMNPDYTKITSKDDQSFGKAIYQWKKNVVNLILWGKSTVSLSSFPIIDSWAQKAQSYEALFPYGKTSIMTLRPEERPKMCDLVPEIIQYGEMLSANIAVILNNCYIYKQILQKHHQALGQAAEAASKL